MSDQSISPVNKVDAASEWPSVVKAPDPASRQDDSRQPEPEKVVDPQSPTTKQPFGDVYLRFQVNKETQEMTIYIIDRASKSVVRTIPPSEANKLSAGDLIELLA